MNYQQLKKKKIGACLYNFLNFIYLYPNKVILNKDYGTI